MKPNASDLRKVSKSDVLNTPLRALLGKKVFVQTGTGTYEKREICGVMDNGIVVRKQSGATTSHHFNEVFVFPKPKDMKNAGHLISMIEKAKQKDAARCGNCAGRGRAYRSDLDEFEVCKECKGRGKK